MCSISDLEHTLDDVDLLSDLSLAGIIVFGEYNDLRDLCRRVVINESDLSTDDEIAYRNKVYAGG